MLDDSGDGCASRAAQRTALGTLLRAAVIEEALGELPVVMTVSEFAELLSVTTVQLAAWECEGRLKPVVVAGERYVFPGLVAELLFDAGRLRIPLPESQARALLHGGRIVRAELSDVAVEALSFEAVLTGLTVDEFAAGVLERYASGGSADGWLRGHHRRRRWFSRGR